MATTYGTACFVNRAAANRHHRPLGYTAVQVGRLLAKRLIHIGPPPANSLLDGECFVLDRAGRYHIRTT